MVRTIRRAACAAGLTALAALAITLLSVAILNEPNPPGQPQLTPTAAPTVFAASAPAVPPVDLEFGRLAELPTDQAEAGAAFARAWCSDVRLYHSVIGHDELVLLFPDLRNFTRDKLLTAAVRMYCPEYEDQIPLITGERKRR